MGERTGALTGPHGVGVVWYTEGCLKLCKLPDGVVR